MNKGLLRVIVFFFVGIYMLSMYQCANIVPPQGGPKDEIPPKLDTLNSSPNYQTNFTKSEIVLTFDEWLVIKDALTQVVVSPPLEYPLSVRLKKKSVSVEFNEQEILKENTTYTINFGDAIQDLTEGNVPPNLRYVFSTGSVIDSLTFQARLVDVFTKKPIADALLMLYTNLADSVVYKTKPYYFAKADTGGVALIENIRADTFKVIALKDDNLNYQLDGETEFFSFLDTTVVVSGNTQIGELELYIGEQELEVRNQRSGFGKYTIYFNQKPFDLNFELINNPPIISYEHQVADSLMFWFRDTSKVDWKVVLRKDTTVIDTLTVRKNSSALPKLTSLYNAETKRKVLSFKSDTTLTYRWSQPIATIDVEKMVMAKDSLTNPIQVSFKIDSIDRHLLIVNATWEHPSNYLWQLDQGAVTDIFGTTNDSIGVISVTAVEDKTYGKVSIHFTGLDSLTNYAVHLLNKSNVVVKKGKVSVDQTKIDFALLDPGIYTIHLFEDDNGNGRWDTGNYDQMRLPERLYIKVMPPLKANWEQTIEFNL